MTRAASALRMSAHHTRSTNHVKLCERRFNDEAENYARLALHRQERKNPEARLVKRLQELQYARALAKAGCE